MVVCTPGRLIAHINMGHVDFTGVKYLVLDEADRMLDMGFSNDINFIISKLPANRQNLMFSATMPDKIRLLPKIFSIIHLNSISPSLSHRKKLFRKRLSSMKHRKYH
jgi:superfamily II DNA/RNA helicase